ncbi:succinate dehydrogenase assembly factor 2 [Catenovulum sp. SM1970]|uniref:FAD assembly factor SdhE n=1 Tax=Marinifaba aquimaris TaxID=2741323 RepID=UPI001571808D|nr:succinate dehydrogenase assembly factor 2 [Marinifaba aquimaris]NTS76430.1 succinate dehydrogenase assembly factor 2 [Marinifaba aquimaris]
MSTNEIIKDTAEVLPRLRWAARRGMLELDVILRPYIDNHYLDSSVEQQMTFKLLLTRDDPELFAWFMGHEVPDDPDFVNLIRHIHEQNGVVLRD